MYLNRNLGQYQCKKSLGKTSSLGRHCVETITLRASRQIIAVYYPMSHNYRYYPTSVLSVEYGTLVHTEDMINIYKFLGVGLTDAGRGLGACCKVNGLEEIRSVSRGSAEGTEKGSWWTYVPEDEWNGWLCRPCHATNNLCNRSPISILIFNWINKAKGPLIPGIQRKGQAIDDFRDPTPYCL